MQISPMENKPNNKPAIVNNSRKSNLTRNLVVAGTSRSTSNNYQQDVPTNA